MSWQRTHKAVQAKRSKSLNQTQFKGTKVKAGDMLAATYMTGSGFSTIKIVLNMAGYQTQSRATYFRHEAECEESLVECAE